MLALEELQHLQCIHFKAHFVQDQATDSYVVHYICFSTKLNTNNW